MDLEVAFVVDSLLMLFLSRIPNNDGSQDEGHRF